MSPYFPLDFVATQSISLVSSASVAVGYAARNKDEAETALVSKRLMMWPGTSLGTGHFTRAMVMVCCSPGPSPRNRVCVLTLCRRPSCLSRTMLRAWPGSAGRVGPERGERARVEVDLRTVDAGPAWEASEGVEADELTPLLRADRVVGGGLKVSLVGVDWRDERRGVAIWGATPIGQLGGAEGGRVRRAGRGDEAQNNPKSSRNRSIQCARKRD